MKDVIKERALLEKHYTDLYEQVARTLFVWENLPDGIPADFIERELFYTGSVLFVKDRQLGYIVSPYVESHYDIYDNATKFQVRNEKVRPALIGYYDRDDVVIIKNNVNKVATMAMIRKNIAELIEIDITKKYNTVWQRMPVVFKASDKTKQSYKSVIEGAIRGINPVIVADQDLTFNGLEILPTGSNYLGGELREEYKMVIGELLTTLGIDNLDIMKKERMITHEVEVNSQEVDINLLKFLEYRERAVEEINEKFGLNIKVSVNEDLAMMKEFDIYEDNNNSENS